MGAVSLSVGRHARASEPYPSPAISTAGSSAPLRALLDFRCTYPTRHLLESPTQSLRQPACRTVTAPYPTASARLPHCHCTPPHAVPCVLVTARGMPDLATRAFAARLAASFPRLQPLGLVDYNPAGVVILTTYKYGSDRLGPEGRA